MVGDRREQRQSPGTGGEQRVEEIGMVPGAQQCPLVAGPGSKAWV